MSESVSRTNSDARVCPAPPNADHGRIGSRIRPMRLMSQDAVRVSQATTVPAPLCDVCDEEQEWTCCQRF